MFHISKPISEKQNELIRHRNALKLSFKSFQNSFTELNNILKGYHNTSVPNELIIHKHALKLSFTKLIITFDLNALKLSFKSFQNSFTELNNTLSEKQNELITPIIEGGNSNFNIDYNISDSTQTYLNNLIFYNIVKYIRYKYYANNMEFVDINVILFKDYFTTLMISILLYVLKFEKLSFGMLIDQIISMGVFYKYRDIKFLIIPYYLSFL